MSSKYLQQTVPIQAIDVRVSDCRIDKETIVPHSSVQQTGTETTAVTLNAELGKINTVTSTAAANTGFTFTCHNDKVRTGDAVMAMVSSYGGIVGAGGCPIAWCPGVSNGQFNVQVFNAHATNALNNTVQIQFWIIHNS